MTEKTLPIRLNPDGRVDLKSLEDSPEGQQISEVIRKGRQEGIERRKEIQHLEHKLRTLELAPIKTLVLDWLERNNLK